MRVTHDDQTGIMSGRCNELGINIFRSKKKFFNGPIYLSWIYYRHSGPGEKKKPSTEVRERHRRRRYRSLGAQESPTRIVLVLGASYRRMRTRGCATHSPFEPGWAKNND